MDKKTPHANVSFDTFLKSSNLVEILELFDALCVQVGIDSRQYEGFLEQVIAKMNLSWKCRKLWECYQAKSGLPVYRNQETCKGLRVLVIGAGPVGLRAAIEAALLGARVDVLEKRKYFSRSNVLHLWPFIVADLRSLGVKTLFPQFCPGGIDHISIRRLQSVLLKVALFLGVKVHAGVEFKSLVEPADGRGWRCETVPADCVVSSYDYDVMIGADGKQYSLPGFVTKEFRPTLAIAVTTNFVRHYTQKEARIEEMSGIIYFCKQNFFKSMSAKLGIDLENLVYYKGETHYFVMTIKKQSLLNRGALKENYDDVTKLLAPDNIRKDVVQQLVKEIASFSTDNQLGVEELKFEQTHRGEDDVALFDFTSLFAAEYASRVIERGGKKLLTCLVGDTLIESFWPTGVGCTRGFLGAFDTAWMIKGYGEGRDVLDLIKEREFLFSKLAYIMPSHLNKKLQQYTLDPATRYGSLVQAGSSPSVQYLYDRGDAPQVPTQVIRSGLLEQRKASQAKRKQESENIRLSAEAGSSSSDDETTDKMLEKPHRTLLDETAQSTSSCVNEEELSPREQTTETPSLLPEEQLTEILPLLTVD